MLRREIRVKEVAFQEGSVSCAIRTSFSEGEEIFLGRSSCSRERIKF